jgi:hypothetical protein
MLQPLHLREKSPQYSLDSRLYNLHTYSEGGGERKNQNTHFGNQTPAV